MKCFIQKKSYGRFSLKKIVLKCDVYLLPYSKENRYKTCQVTGS